MEGNTIYSSQFIPPRSRKDRLLQNSSAAEMCNNSNNGRSKQKFEQYFNVFMNVLPPVMAVLCYLNGLDGDFVHDDVYAIRDNADATGTAPLSRLLVDDFWGAPMCDNASHKSYRPLTVLTFRLNYQLAGGVPWPFHAVNVALHALVTWLYGHVLRHVLHVQDGVTVLAALLFAVHPVHTEAVTGIVGRAELLSCVGVMLTLILYSRSLSHGFHTEEKEDVKRSASTPPTRRPPPPSSSSSSLSLLRKWYFCLAMLSCGAAMLCKEHGIMGLAVCAVLDIFVFSRTFIRRWLSTRRRKTDPVFRALCTRIAAVVCVGAGLMGFRLWMMCGQSPFFTEEDNPASFSPSLLTRVLTFNYLLAFNAWLLLCPSVLNYDWQVGSIPLLSGLSDVRNLATLLFYLFLASAGIVCLRDFIRQDETKDANIHNDNNNNNNNNKSNISTTTTTTTTTTNNTTSTNNNSNNMTTTGKDADRSQDAKARRSSSSSSNSSNSSSSSISSSSNGSNSRSSSSPESPWHVLLVGLTLMVLPFVPASNLFFRVGFVVAERVLYMPSTGWCLLVAQGGMSVWHRCRQHPHGRRLILCLTALLLPLMAARTVHRNTVWSTRESLFRSGIQTLPHNAKMHYNYANFLKDSGDHGGAETHYRTAVRLYSKQPSYHNNLGTVVSNVTEAEQCYRAALRLKPDHRGALVNLGNLLINLNDSTGEGLLHRALVRDPDYLDALVSVTQLAVRRGRWGEAGQWVSRALVIHPDIPSLHYYKGIILHHSGQYEAAVVSYNQAVSLDQGFTSALVNAAVSLRQLGREHEAELYLKRAVAAGPDRQALEQLSHLYRRTGRLEDAVNVYTQMARMAPNDTDLMINFVKTLMENGQHKQAEEVLTPILVRAPHNPEVLYATGHVQLALGKKQEALSTFQEASRWTQGAKAELSAQILHDMGNVYKDLSMFPQALEKYQASVTVDPSFTAARHNLAVLHHILEQYDQALHHYELVLREEPDNQLLKDNLAKLQRVSRAHGQHSKQRPPPPPPQG